jgi:hypothetical protein
MQDRKDLRRHRLRFYTWDVRADIEGYRAPPCIQCVNYQPNVGCARSRRMHISANLFRFMLQWAFEEGAKLDSPLDAQHHMTTSMYQIPNCFDRQ